MLFHVFENLCIIVVYFNGKQKFNATRAQNIESMEQRTATPKNNLYEVIYHVISFSKSFVAKFNGVIVIFLA